RQLRPVSWSIPRGHSRPHCPARTRGMVVRHGGRELHARREVSNTFGGPEGRRCLEGRLERRDPRVYTWRSCRGPLAQLVEQETLNLWVLGSSPRRVPIQTLIRQ